MNWSLKAASCRLGSRLKGKGHVDLFSLRQSAKKYARRRKENEIDTETGKCLRRLETVGQTKMKTVIVA